MEARYDIAVTSDGNAEAVRVPRNADFLYVTRQRDVELVVCNRGAESTENKEVWVGADRPGRWMHVTQGILSSLPPDVCVA